MHSGIEYYGMSLAAILETRVTICSIVCFMHLSQINNFQQSVFKDLSEINRRVRNKFINGGCLSVRGKKIVYEISSYITFRIFTISGQFYSPPPSLRLEQNSNLQIFLSGIGDTFVTLKANAKEIVTLKCI